MQSARAAQRPLRYVNRNGQRFYIRECRKGGAIRYVASRSSDSAVTRLPPQYEVRENINGYVSVGTIQPRQITEAEERLAKSVLAQLKPYAYRAEVWAKAITIFASALDRKSFAGSVDAEFAEGFAAAMEQVLSRRYGQELASLFRARRRAREGTPKPLRYYPLLQFELINRKDRLFKVKRIYFTGDQDWLCLETLSLSAALMKYVPHLGKDSFFDLL